MSKEIDKSMVPSWEQTGQRKTTLELFNELLDQGTFEFEQLHRFQRNTYVSTDKIRAAVPGQHHIVADTDIGKTGVLLFSTPGNDEYRFLMFAPDCIDSSTRISLEILGAGWIRSVGSDRYEILRHPYTDFYEPTVTFDSLHLMTKELNEIYGWECNDEYDELTELFLHLQGWLFGGHMDWM